MQQLNHEHSQEGCEIGIEVDEEQFKNDSEPTTITHATNQSEQLSCFPIPSLLNKPTNVITDKNGMIIID